MKAEEARNITLRSLKGVYCEQLLKIAYNRIKKFAEKGEFSVPYPFYGAKFNIPKSSIKLAILKLEEDGFKATYHDNSRSQDPRDQSYWEISW